VHPELLAISDETIDVRQQLYMPGNAADELRGSPNVDHHKRQPTPLSHSRSGSVSLVFSDACQPSSPEVVADRIDADADLPIEEVIHHAARQSSSQPAHDEKIELPSLPSESDATDVSWARDFVTKKNIPFLIVSSDDIEATRSSPTAVQLPRQPTAIAQLPRDSDIINLCSDDEDSIMGGSFKAEIDGTPDFEDELRWPSQKRKRGGMQEVSDDGDDDVLEEVDGNAWRRASLRQS
jgi:hypothetical protein